MLLSSYFQHLLLPRIPMNAILYFFGNVYLAIRTLPTIGCDTTFSAPSPCFKCVVQYGIGIGSPSLDSTMVFLHRFPLRQCAQHCVDLFVVVDFCGSSMCDDFGDAIVIVSRFYVSYGGAAMQRKI